MKRLFLLILTSVLTLSAASAQKVCWGKMSPMLRQMVRQYSCFGDSTSRKQYSPTFTQYSAPLGKKSAPLEKKSAPLIPEVCAFIQIADSAAQVLSENGCRDLASVGNIHIASIPVDRLVCLSLDTRVKRIEARPMGQILLDSVSRSVNAMPVYEGTFLPHAYTGKGVVVGIMDIGFDLTHPTFRLSSSTRIRRFWDMLSTDTVASSFYVGRDYVVPEEILALGHSRDGLDQTHGTHTAGIAAGNGYDSPYRGLAPESDICLVANAVSENAALIDSALLSRFTFATDALGFKYLFDYAQEQDQPCVVSFSEGSGQDFWGYDQLYYEMLDGLLGPGRIMVVAAGNQGTIKSWLSKPSGPETDGFFVRHSDGQMLITLKSANDFAMRLVTYSNNDSNDTLAVTAHDVWTSPDSLLVLHMSETDSILVQAYPNSYNAVETCYDLILCSAAGTIGIEAPLSFEVLDNQAEVSCWRYNGEWTTNDLNPLLHAGEATHNILSPASAPRVICVGATTHRDSIMNLDGQWKSYWTGETGMRAPFSSVGPTMDGRTKPDVMAPGNNIISAYSSYYLENHPTANDIRWDVAHFDYEGRTYAWNSNTGTSMACPVVAGVIALWLQANPNLTPEDIMEVIRRTSRQPDPTLDYPNNEYGYGEIDAYHGLLDILGLDCIDAISTAHTPARVTLKGRQLMITPNPSLSPSPLTVTLYSLTGRQVFNSTIFSPITPYLLTLPASLPPDVYAVQFDGPATVSGSTLIRLTH